MLPMNFYHHPFQAFFFFAASMIYIFLVRPSLFDNMLQESDGLLLARELIQYELAKPYQFRLPQIQKYVAAKCRQVCSFVPLLNITNKPNKYCNNIK